MITVWIRSSGLYMGVVSGCGQWVWSIDVNISRGAAMEILRLITVVLL